MIYIQIQVSGNMAYYVGTHSLLRAVEALVEEALKSEGSPLEGAKVVRVKLLLESEIK